MYLNTQSGLLSDYQTIHVYCTSQNRLKVPAFSAAGHFHEGSGTCSKPCFQLNGGAGKGHASFAEMLAALRIDSLAEFKRKHLSIPGVPAGIHKLLKPLEYLIALAA